MSETIHERDPTEPLAPRVGTPHCVKGTGQASAANCLHFSSVEEHFSLDLSEEGFNFCSIFGLTSPGTAKCFCLSCASSTVLALGLCSMYALE